MRANQYMNLCAPERTQITEVRMRRRPSTFCRAVIKLRNFYTDREKPIGKLFPTALQPVPLLTPNVTLPRTPAPRHQVLPRLQTSPGAIAAVVCFPSGAWRRLPLHDGSKSTKVVTVWSIRYTSCTKLGNRGPSQAVPSAQPGSGPLCMFERLSFQVAPVRRLRCCVGRWHFSLWRW